MASEKSRLTSLKSLISEGEKLGFDFRDCKDKVSRLIDSLQDDELRIVLLGSFSDGKTTSVAGLLGEVEANMKIDNDESSDDLTVYHPAGMPGVKIIDTPGLFGTKEKEVDGRNVRFSDITTKFISEAHIILYVCSAVLPIKESHAEVISRVMRDYHKLDNTIFVINKMDDAGYDLTDDDDFRRGAAIKRQNLITSLRDFIHLTPDEESRLNIVCIAADPKGKGLLHWFAKMKDYVTRSHIGDLRCAVDKIRKSSDVSKLKADSVRTSVNDVLDSVVGVISDTSAVVRSQQEVAKRQRDECQSNSGELRTELRDSRSQLRDRLRNLCTDVKVDVKNATLETFGEVVERDFGTNGSEVTFSVFKDKVNSMIEQCCETNAKAVDAAAVRIEKSFDEQNSMLMDAAGLGSKFLRNASVSGSTVLSVRNAIASGYKFKPWGAIKMGKNITKVLKGIGVLIAAAIEIFTWYKKHKAAEAMEKAKSELIKAVDETFSNLSATFDSDDEFFKNYAPSYGALCDQLKERDAELERISGKVRELEAYKARVDRWRNSGDYVAYEEVK